MARPPATCVSNHWIPRYLCPHPPTSSPLQHIYKYRHKYKYRKIQLQIQIQVSAQMTFNILDVDIFSGNFFTAVFLHQTLRPKDKIAKSSIVWTVATFLSSGILLVNRSFSLGDQWVIYSCVICVTK